MWENYLKDIKLECLEVDNPIFVIVCAINTNIFGPSVKEFGPINIHIFFLCQTAPWKKVKEK